MSERVRALELTDLPTVVDVHLSAFAGQALSKLGAEAVRRYYLSLHRGPFELTALGAFAGTRLEGFLYGGMLRGEMSYFLDHNRGFLITTIATRPWLLANPLFRNRLKLGLGLIRKPEQLGRRAEEVKDPSLRSFGILSIAVAASLQRGGVGRALMAAAENTARAQGYTRMHLTVHPNNQKAIDFYQAEGWTKHIVNGAWTTGMRKSLTSGTVPSTR
jgi:ribosomal protein S18 acetylase RimI-like enzyme